MSSIIGKWAMPGKAAMQPAKPVSSDLPKCSQGTGQPQYPLQCHCSGICGNRYDQLLKRWRGAEKYKAGIPLGRFASGEDIANVALFLASDWGNYITGQTISACGGLNI
jgi:3-oxoacyl-[acyl-carrier protein] reductase